MSWKIQGFDSSGFIQQYWQKKPCLIRQAFRDFKPPISPEELAGLACESDVHSRLIIESDADTPWSVSYGPFQESDFHALPETHYSLLVSECEKWIPGLSDLRDQFRFIPDWRIDDLMVSYAPPGGSVGPHSDEYDVFLLQVEGSRKWQYTNKRVDEPRLISGLDLAIMRNFKADQEAILVPGDMLYLPPGIAHHGVAVDACMTISIGFRAPAALEVIESFMLEADRQKSDSRRYTDPDLEIERHFSEITPVEINRFKTMALSVMEQTEGLWLDAVGKLLSDSLVAGLETNNSPAGLQTLSGNNWIVNPESRMLYHLDDSEITFFCDGRSYKLPEFGPAVEFIQNLCEFRFISVDSMDACHGQTPLIEILSELRDTGALLPVEE